MVYFIQGSWKMNVLLSKLLSCLAHFPGEEFAFRLSISSIRA